MKRIVLCADDYGQAPAISRGILSLINENRLSAASCMVTSPYWLEHVKWLTPYINKVDIGLHFNLTHGTPLSPAFKTQYGQTFAELSQVLKKSLLRNWDVEAIYHECCAQIEMFKKGLGCLPDFIDGHQHIHQFPMIREALVRAYHRYWGNDNQPKAFIRLVNQNSLVTPRSALKLLTIRTSGAFFARLLQANHIPHNHSFAGIYPFSQSRAYTSWFARFLKNTQDNGLIMCHPGLSASSNDDPIATARFDEYRYLSSPQFLLDCEQHTAVLSRFSA